MLLSNTVVDREFILSFISQQQRLRCHSITECLSNARENYLRELLKSGGGMELENQSLNNIS